MGRKRIMTKLLTCFTAAATAVTGIPMGVPLSARAAEAGSYTAAFEARIGDTRYEKLEEAFDNAQPGDTIIVLKDCSVSKTLEVTEDNITLTSGDAGNPASICRGEEFSGKNYGKDAGNVLVGISSGSLATRDIILDGGAALDEDFNNTGQVWDSPLIYVKGSYVIEEGTVLQNNYNTDYSESVDSSRSVRTAGALEVAGDGFLTMGGGLILDGEIVMDDNTFSDGIRNDIVFWYDDSEPVCLGESLTSTSAFKISGYEITSGKLAVDATTNGKETDAEQFSSCHGRFKTEEKGGDIYFTEIYRVLYFLDGKGYLDPETYAVGEPATTLSVVLQIRCTSSMQIRCA